MKTLYTIGETIRNSNMKSEVIHTFGENIVKKLSVADWRNLRKFRLKEIHAVKKL